MTIRSKIVLYTLTSRFKMSMSMLKSRAVSGMSAEVYRKPFDPIILRDSQVATSRSRASVIVRASAESVDRRALLGVAAAGKITYILALNHLPILYISISQHLALS